MTLNSWQQGLAFATMIDDHSQLQIKNMRHTIFEMADNKQLC
jgi:hypothetical protein